MKRRNTMQLLSLNARERSLFHELLVKVRKEELLKHSITSKNTLHYDTLVGAYKVMPVLLGSFNPLLLVRYPLSNKITMRCQFSTFLCGCATENKSILVKNNSEFDDLFLGKIDVKYNNSKKNKLIRVSFDFWEIQRDIMTNRIVARLDLDYVYTVFIKVRYSVDRYFMVGNQFGFNYDNIYKLTDIFDTVVNRLEEYMEDYDLKEDEIVYVELSFRKKDKVLLSEFSYDFKKKK